MGKKQCLTESLLAVLLIVFLSGCARNPQEKYDAFLQRGKNYLQKRDYRRALLELQNALSINRRNPEIYYQIGLAYIGTGDVNSAAGALRRTLELEPKHSGAELKLAQLAAGSRDKADVEEAEKRLARILANAPADLEALNTLALAQWRLGRREEAEQTLYESVSKFPGDVKSAANLARVRLARQDVTGAEQILKNVAARNARSADAAVMLGAFYLLAGRPSEGERWFRQALLIDDRNGMALVSLAGVRWGAGHTEEAEELYRRASAVADQQFRPVYAMFLLESGRREAAIAELERQVKENPADRSVRSRLVAAYHAANRVSDAEKVLGGALRKNPRDSEALLQQSELHLRGGRYAEAEEALTRVLHFHRDSAAVHYLLGRVHEKRGATFSQKHEWGEALRLDPGLLAVRVELAQLLISTKAAKAALDLLNGAPAEQKSAPAIVVQQNWANISLGDWKAAREGIDRALATAKGPEVFLQDATFKLAHRDPAGARKSLAEALKQNPEEIRALNLLVETYELQKQTSVALQKVREYASGKPKSAPLQQFLGELLLKAGDRPAARNAFVAAKAAALPGFHDPDLWLSQIDISEGKLREARERLMALASSHATDVFARLLLGVVEERAGNFEEAARLYREVIAVNDQNVMALNNLAFLLAEYKNRPDEALPLAQRARELLPDSSNVQDTLGWVLYRKGLYSSAIPHLEQAASREPTGLRKCHLAMAYFKSGDQRARQTLDSALKMDPELLKGKFYREFLEEMAGLRKPSSL